MRARARSAPRGQRLATPHAEAPGVGDRLATPGAIRRGGNRGLTAAARPAPGGRLQDQAGSLTTGGEDPDAARLDQGLDGAARQRLADPQALGQGGDLDAQAAAPLVTGDQGMQTLRQRDALLRFRRRA